MEWWWWWNAVFLNQDSSVSEGITDNGVLCPSNVCMIAKGARIE